MTISMGVSKTVQKALDIPKLTHAEAGKLAQTEYKRGDRIT